MILTHFDKLELVLQKLQEAGLKLNLPKCKFLCSCIEFLGHVVDKHDIHTTDAKVRAVQDFPIPKSVNHLRSFFCLAGYYRAFIRDFASIASPLTRLLKNDVSFVWHDAQQTSVDRLKHALTHAPVLAFSDYSQPFTLFTDASASGVGALLM